MHRIHGFKIWTIKPKALSLVGHHSKGIGLKFHGIWISIALSNHENLENQRFFNGSFKQNSRESLGFKREGKKGIIGEREGFGRESHEDKNTPRMMRRKRD